MSLENIAKLNGGVAPDLNASIMPDNMLESSLNVYWDGKLKKRYGEKTVQTIGGYPASGDTYAACFIEWNSTTYLVAAVLDGSTVKFYSSHVSGAVFSDFAQITSPTTITWATGQYPKMVAFNTVISCCDTTGTQKPLVFYYDSGVKCQTIEAYDTRTRGNLDWYAGFYDDAETHQFADDTDDAQSTTTGDFALATASGDDTGFYVSGIVTFNKIVLKEADVFSGSPVATYKYYKGNSTWDDLTLVTTPTWTVSGDKTIEFDYPTDWEQWDGEEAYSGGQEVVGSLTGRYVVKVVFTTAPTNAPFADYLEIAHTQYLSTVMDGEIPTHICVHHNRLYLGVGNTVNYSPFGSITGWEAYYVEYFDDGGTSISSLSSFGEVLLVTKPGAIYIMAGTSYENFLVKKISNLGSTDGDRGVVTNGNFSMFVSQDGHIVITQGALAMYISKHIYSLLSGQSNYILTGARTRAFMSRGYFIVLNTSGYGFIIDPDSIDVNKDGDGVGAFYPITATYREYVENPSAYIKGRSYGISGAVLYEIDAFGVYGNYATHLKTKHYDFGALSTRKVFKRMKIRASSIVTVEIKHIPDMEPETIYSGSRVQTNSITSQAVQTVTGDTTLGSAVISDITVAQLSLVRVGDSINDVTRFWGGAVIEAIDYVAGTITMNQTARATASNVAFSIYPGMKEVEMTMHYNTTGNLLSTKVTAPAQAIPFSVDALTFDVMTRRY